MKRLIAAILLIGCITGFKSGTVKRITILSTSDIHGRIDGYDYNSGINLPVGLDRIYSIAAGEKKLNDSVLVLDSGDFNRGTPMVDLYNTKLANEPNPVVGVMNRIGYDAVTPGNHDLDYGIDTLMKIGDEANFPVISANIYYKNKLLFKPYEVEERQGIKIGIIGLTTTAALRYNAGDNIEGVEIRNIEEQAAKYIDILRNEEKADIVIALVHSGIEGVYKAPADETDVVKIANLPDKPDMIISGHSHMIIPYMNINGVIVQSPGAFGEGMGKAQITLERMDGRWRISDKKCSFIPAFTALGDKSFDAAAAGFRDAALSYINSSAGDVSNPYVSDINRLVDAVKKRDAGADAVISEGLRYKSMKKNKLTVKDLYSLYGRENYIVGVEAKGRNIRNYLQERYNRGLKDYNNLYGIDSSIDSSGIKLYLGDRLIQDDDLIKLAVTGRQLKQDKLIKESGIGSGKEYYSSYLSFGLSGRVRQRIYWYLKNNEI